MFTVTRYPHGTFCRADLSTHGGSDAVQFYSQLMGWQTETQETIFGIPYTMFRVDGHVVAGLAWLPAGASGLENSARLFDIPEKRSIVSLPSWYMQTKDYGRIAELRGRRHVAGRCPKKFPGRK